VLQSRLVLWLLAALASSACALPHAGLRRDDAPDPIEDASVQPDTVDPSTPDAIDDRLVPSDNPCPMGRVRCGARCVDTSSDNAHCGGCDRPCATGATCSSGICGYPVGQGLCMGRCVNTQSDIMNCGACGNACAAGQLCVAGACSTSCAAPMMTCGGSCVDLRTDAAHCGSCGNACPAGQSCVAGACTLVCTAPSIACMGRCVNVTNDPSHCGMCGRGCGAPDGGAAPTCAASACTGGACPSGTHLCPAVSSCLRDDSPASCGARCDPCPTVANATATCTGGACGFTCAPGFSSNGTGCVTIGPATCGNGMLDSGETCDDGALLASGMPTSGDGCSAMCAREANVLRERCDSTAAYLSIRSGQTILLRGSTTGFNSDYDRCGGSGKDTVLGIRAIDGGTLTVSVAPTGGWDVVVRVGSMCPGETCIDDRTVAGATERFTASVSGGANVNVIIDGYSGAEGSFVATISLR
jgi:cysteine-rich repeat protein